MADTAIHSQKRPSPAALARQLEHLGLPFVVTTAEDEPPSILSTAEFIAALADCDEARLRMALIPLFIAHPEDAHLVLPLSGRLAGQARANLVCYYTAAVLLQRKHARRLASLGVELTELPDIFGQPLGLPPSGDVDALLQMLADIHAQLSGRPLNWYGTYLHAIERYMRRLELEAQWKES